MEEEESIILAERLIATVARAFYTDNYVVLFDALVREKYIREEELGPRLKLPNEEVRKMIVLLEKERLISFEERLMESDQRRSQCYYIDYQHFVHIVRYRIHLMQKGIKNSENVELNTHFLICPTCKEKYSELQYHKVRDKNHKFICPHCCPLQSFRLIESEKYYQLVEYDRTDKVIEVQSLDSKFKSQLGRADGLHEGIYELLALLKDVHLPRNLPSDNIERGNVASRVTDTEVQSQIDYNNIGIKSKKLTKAQQARMSGGADIRVEVEEEASTSRKPSAAAESLPSEEPQPKRAKTLPAFLQGSRIREDGVAALMMQRDGDTLPRSSTSTEYSTSTATAELKAHVKEEAKPTTSSASAMVDDEDMWED